MFVAAWIRSWQVLSTEKEGKGYVTSVSMVCALSPLSTRVTPLGWWTAAAAMNSERLWKHGVTFVSQAK